MNIPVSSSSLLALVCCLLASRACEGGQPPLAKEGESGGQPETLAEGKGGENQQVEDNQTVKDNKEKFFLWAQYSTTTKFMLSFTTTSIPTTCISAFNTGVCAGRRKKSFGKLSNFKVTMGGGLDGSLTEATEDERSDAAEQEARKLLTVWSTAFSTKTATSWFVNTSVTIKLSAACSIPGLVYPLCAG